MSEKDIHIASLLARLERAEERGERLEWERNLFREEAEALTNQVPPYNEIGIPSEGLKEIETKLAICDKYTANAIADYLVLDSYELVKNLAKTVNSSNASEVIAYRDGALSRNEATIKVLRKIGKDDSFKNRIDGAVQNKP